MTSALAGPKQQSDVEEEWGAKALYLAGFIRVYRREKEKTSSQQEGQGVGICRKISQLSENQTKLARGNLPSEGGLRNVLCLEQFAAKRVARNAQKRRRLASIALAEQERLLNGKPLRLLQTQRRFTRGCRGWRSRPLQH